MNQRSKRAIIERYLRKVRRALPIPGKTKRALVQQIRESIYEQTGEATELDEAALVEKFGTPRQIVESYVENMTFRSCLFERVPSKKVRVRTLQRKGMFVPVEVSGVSLK